MVHNRIEEVRMPAYHVSSPLTTNEGYMRTHYKTKMDNPIPTENETKKIVCYLSEKSCTGSLSP